MKINRYIPGNQLRLDGTPTAAYSQDSCLSAQMRNNTDCVHSCHVTIIPKLSGLKQQLFVEQTVLWVGKLGWPLLGGSSAFVRVYSAFAMNSQAPRILVGLN